MVERRDCERDDRSLRRRGADPAESLPRRPRLGGFREPPDSSWHRERRYGAFRVPRAGPVLSSVHSCLSVTISIAGFAAESVPERPHR